MGIRKTFCTQCDEAVEFADEAKSINCRHCNTRVITEPLDVSEYVAVRRVATANRMKITKKGKVFASVRADALEIEGFLHGDATSLSGIRIKKSAQVTGSLRAAWLSLEPGATLVGDVKIGPEWGLPCPERSARGS
jgi:DNA-directed RNA polymerase subunit RPC12/RpoP